MNSHGVKTVLLVMLYQILRCFLALQSPGQNRNRQQLMDDIHRPREVLQFSTESAISCARLRSWWNVMENQTKTEFENLTNNPLHKHKGKSIHSRFPENCSSFLEMKCQTWMFEWPVLPESLLSCSKDSW